MSARDLEADLRALGIDCAVDGRDRLAILIPNGDPGRLASDDVRREAVRLAESHGFTHLALEIGDDVRADADS